MENKDLLESINQVMPYGKYKGRYLLDLPEPHLVWYHSKGFPQGIGCGSRVGIGSGCIFSWKYQSPACK